MELDLTTQHVHWPVVGPSVELRPGPCPVMTPCCELLLVWLSHRIIQQSHCRKVKRSIKCWTCRCSCCWLKFSPFFWLTVQKSRHRCFQRLCPFCSATVRLGLFTDMKTLLSRSKQCCQRITANKVVPQTRLTFCNLFTLKAPRQSFRDQPCLHVMFEATTLWLFKCSYSHNLLNMM